MRPTISRHFTGNSYNSPLRKFDASGKLSAYMADAASPLQKQKLSPKAAKAKAARDLAYAETPDRRAKKADDQRRHRHDPSGKGKDWDHEDGRWEDPHQNRGNDGNGTKGEHGKHYKIDKKS